MDFSSEETKETYTTHNDDDKAIIEQPHTEWSQCFTPATPKPSSQPYRLTLIMFSLGNKLQSASVS